MKAMITKDTKEGGGIEEEVMKVATISIGRETLKTRAARVRISEMIIGISIRFA